MLVIDAGTVDTAALDAGVRVAKPIDAGTSIARTVDAGVRVAKAIDAGAVTPPGNDDDDDGARDPATAAVIADAEAALRGGDPEQAIRIAKRAINNGMGAPALRVVKARAECAMGDREAATATLQKVRRPRLERAILARCGGE